MPICFINTCNTGMMENMFKKTTQRKWAGRNLSGLIFILEV